MFKKKKQLPNKPKVISSIIMNWSFCQSCQRAKLLGSILKLKWYKDLLLYHLLMVPILGDIYWWILSISIDFSSKIEILLHSLAY